MTKFFIPCDPVKTTSQQKGACVVQRANGRAGVLFFKKKKTQAAETLLYWLFRQHAPKQPLTGPLDVHLRITFPMRQSDAKHRRVQGLRPCWIPKPTRPDADNLAKMILDVMGKLGFWEDDAQIASLGTVKGWGSEPGYDVQIKKMEDGK